MERPENESSNGRSLLSIALASLGIVTTGAFIAGFLAQHHGAGGGAFNAVATTILAAAAALIIALTYICWRNVRALKFDGEGLSRRERLNRNLLVACMVIGGVIGLVMALAETGEGVEGMSMFSNSRLPTGIALALAFVWAAIVPGIAWYWHRYAVDEQERHAYREGAYYAFYAYAIGAPLWWILWRGGLAPAPDGIIIYYITIAVCGVVWMWKKYR